MQTSAVSGTTTAAGSRSDRGVGSLSSEDFFKILVTEMQHQDPLEPSKTSDMIGQVSQIRSIELSSKLGSTLDALVQQQRMSEAGGLIGKYVSAIVSDGGGGYYPADGVVLAVHYADDGAATLELDSGATVRMTDVQMVTTPEEVARLTGEGADLTAKLSLGASRQRATDSSDFWSGVKRMLHIVAK